MPTAVQVHQLVEAGTRLPPVGASRDHVVHDRGLRSRSPPGASNASPGPAPCGVRPRIAGGCWLVLRNRLIGVIDDADRPWSTRLPRDEPTTLQRLNHLIYGRCRNEEVSLDIRFGWGNTEPEDVPFDERKVLALTAGGLRAVVETFPHRVAGAASQGGDEAVSN